MSKENASKAELTSYLYSKLNQTKDNLQKRMRARTLLSEVDKISLKDFHKIIQISKDRADNVKFGKSLNHELNLSDTKYKLLSNDLCRKNMYFSQELKQDRERLKQNLNKNDYKEILSLFKMIKDNNESIKRKLNKEVKRQSIQFTNNNSNNNHHSSKISIDTNANEEQSENIINKDIMQVIINKPMYKSVSQENILKAETYINELFELENSQLNNTIHEYLDMTKQIKEQSPKLKENDTHTSYSKQYKVKDKQVFKRTIAKKCISFANSLQILNYQRAVIPEMGVKPKEKKEEFDIKRMVKYTSMGEFPCLSPINNSNKNNNNNKEFIDESFIDLEKSEIDLSKSDLYDVNNNKDISNNIDIVKQELALDRKVRDTFKTRGEAIDEFINQPNLPSLNNYSSKINSINIHR